MTGFQRGEWVYVDPHDPSAPREVRGLTGQVKSVDDEHALVVFRNDDSVFPLEVAVSVLQRDRRRKNRPPVRWSGDELGATG